MAPSAHAMGDVLAWGRRSGAGGTNDAARTGIHSAMTGNRRPSLDDSVDNPEANALGSGVSEAQIIEAAERSGFPLQTITAERLRDSFRVQEEWAYVDRDTQELRTIDILAERWLFPLSEISQLHIRPTLDLIVECKKSELPFVFFLSGPTQQAVFPAIAGLKDQSISLTTDDNPSTFVFHISDLLGLEEDKFFVTPKYCYSFSRANRKGTNLELGASDSFHSIVLPLLKAVHHFNSTVEPSSEALYFDCHMTVPLAVIDGPMVAVSSIDGSTNAELTPWIRTIRRETEKEYYTTDGTKQVGIDVVHKEFLPEYIENYLLPFSQRFAARVKKHEKVILTGQGFAAGLGGGSIVDLEGRLRERTIRKQAGRVRMIGNNIARVLTGRKPIGEE